MRSKLILYCAYLISTVFHCLKGNVSVNFLKAESISTLANGTYSDLFNDAGNIILLTNNCSELNN